MKKSKLFWSCFLLLVIVSTTVGWQVTQEIDLRLFISQVLGVRAPTLKQTPCLDTKGGIVPHHLLASKIIDEFFESLSCLSVKTIVLLGPNHPEIGNKHIYSSLQDWSTDAGILNSDQSLINDLCSESLVKIDEDIVVGEHSIANVVPFVKKHLPQSKIVPLVVSGKTSLDEIESLASKLNQKVKEGEIVIIASVDFSHYLQAEDANTNDRLTIKHIKNFDYRSILLLDSDYLDSPPSVALLLYLMQQGGYKSIDVLAHSNSAEILADDFIATTSYYSIMFY